MFQSHTICFAHVDFIYLFIFTFIFDIGKNMVLLFSDLCKIMNHFMSKPATIDLQTNIHILISEGLHKNKVL